MKRIEFAGCICLFACQTEPVEPGLCEELGSGGLVTLEVVGVPITLWVTDERFLAEAREVEGQGSAVARIPLFDQVLFGSTCDEAYDFHVDPADVSWADVTIERCDATPTYVDENLLDWFIDVGAWCPWDAAVVEVWDLE